MGVLNFMPWRRHRGASQSSGDVITVSPSRGGATGTMQHKSSAGNIETLEAQLAAAGDDSKQKYYRKKLNRKYFEKLLAVTDVSEAESLLVKLDDAELIAALGYRSECSDIAVAAASRVDDEELILKIFRNTSDKHVCQVLLKKKLSADILEKISNSAACKTVRRQAGEILDDSQNQLKDVVREQSETESSSNTFAEYRDLIGKYEEICVAVEEMAERVTEDSSARLSQIEQEWHLLENVPPRFMEVLEKRFEKAVELLNKNIQANMERERLTVSCMERLEELCVNAEQTVETGDRHKCLKKLKQLRKEWDETAAKIAGNDTAELNARMKTAEKSADDAIAAERREQENLQEQLQGYLKEVKDAIISDDFKNFSTRIRELRTQVNEDSTFHQQSCRNLVNDFKSECHKYFVKLKDSYEAAEYERCANSVVKQDLCAKAEALLKESDIRYVSKQLKSLHSAWRNSGHAHREEENKLYERFKNACDELHNRCTEFYQKQDEARQENLVRKQSLAEEADALKLSEDWRPTAERLKQLQKEWKNIGPGTRDQEPQVYQKFREACNTFFERRGKHYEGLKQEWDAHAEVKRGLIAETLKLDKMEYHEAISFIKQLRESWKNAGPAGKQVEQELWSEFDGTINAFFARLDEQKPENLSRKLELCSQGEAFIAELKEQPDFNYNDKSHQAEQLLEAWKAVGPVPQDKEQELWERFDAPLKEFYNMRRKFFAEQDQHKQQSLTEKLKLIDEIEHLVEHIENWQENTEKVKDIQHRWKEAGPTFHDKEQELWKHFHGICEDFFNERKTFFDRRRDEREHNLKKKLELCVRMEKLAGVEAPENSAINGSSLADELAFALKAGGLDDRGRKHAVEQARIINSEWRNIGFAGKDEEQLYFRFKRAREEFFSE